MRAAPFAILTFMITGAVGSAGVVNGDFQTGNLSGWSVFTTPNGSNGGGLPGVLSFDTLNNGIPSLAARFAVGEIDTTHFGSPADNAGGGIVQTLSLLPGTYVFSAAIAGINFFTLSQAEVGIFSVLFDGSTVQTIDLGGAAASQTKFGSFNFTIPVAGGPTHTLAIQITRPYSGGAGFVEEYVDNISLTSSTSVPEPNSLLLLLCGASALAVLVRRRS